ncbi:MAG: hypothetical protein LBC67_01160 [Spirochaetales bacterium]|nr:hypothetical protein [Spirochaetales bacterium]
MAGFCPQNPVGNSSSRKGLVASPSDLLLAHAAWIGAEIPQKNAAGVV